MSSYIDWNLFLAGYQKSRGGSFFSCGRERLNQCDSQLVLPDGEEPPLLILLQRCAEGRSSWNSLTARTTVHLDGSYRLHIRRKDLTGAGFQTLMSLAGERRDYGDPAALKGRVVTTDDRAFTKLVLGDLELRNALTARPGDSLRVAPAPWMTGRTPWRCAARILTAPLPSAPPGSPTTSPLSPTTAFSRTTGRSPSCKRPPRRTSTGRWTAFWRFYGRRGTQ